MKLIMILCAGALFFPGVIMPKKDSLKTYKKRRNIKKSGEPAGASRKPSKNAPHFVIQKHAASHLH